MKLEKRDAILKAALTLISERGFHNTPTSLIAKEAGELESLLKDFLD